MAKLWVASHGVVTDGGLDTGKQHGFYIYDPDGDPTTGDELIFRSGPENDNEPGLGNIEIENWVPAKDVGVQGEPGFILASEDGYYDLDGNPIGDPVADNNITDTGLTPAEADAFKAAVENWANQYGETGANGRIVTEIPYTAPLPDDNGDWNVALDDQMNGTNNFQDQDIGAALNSNTTFYEAGKAGGLDVDNNLPRENGTGDRLSPNAFPGGESHFSNSSGDVYADLGDGRIFYNGGGDNTYYIDAGVPAELNDVITIFEDGDASTLDKVVLQGVNPEGVYAYRNTEGDLVILIEGKAGPAVIIKDQWDSSGVPKVNTLWVEPPGGGAPQVIPLNDPNDFPLNGPEPIGDWIPGVLSPMDGENGINDMPGQSPEGLNGANGIEPLVLDLDRSGTIDLVSVENSTAFFDFWGDGYAEKVGWAAPSDGMLAIDLDGNGNINGVEELFGSRYPLNYLMADNWSQFTDVENGFARLEKLDDNGDGVVDAADVAWGDLLVWQDLDQDGISDAGELLTLDALGIESIDVANYALDGFVGFALGGFTRVIEGNTVTHTSTFTMTDGTTHEIADVWFDNDLMNTYYTEDYTLDIRTLFMPTLRGYGMLPDLHVAMSQDTTLLTAVQDFVANRDFSQMFSDFDAVRSDIKSILLGWAGVTGPAEGYDDGLYGQLPEYLFLKKWTGIDIDALETWFDGSPYLPVVSGGIDTLYNS